MKKVTCDWVQTHLMAYLKNGLSTTERFALAEHLTICDVCAQEVQETKTFEADLFAEAGQYRPNLSQEASLRIQKQVYRRMRRALVVQRTVALFQMAGAVVTSILLLGGALLFGNQWVAFLSDSSAISGERPTASEQPSTTYTAAPTTAVSPTAPDPTTPFSLTELTSPTPGATPEDIVYAFMEATLLQDSERMAELLVAMRSNKEPTLRMWRSFGQRCGGLFTADSLQYEAVPLRPGITARVEMYQNGRFIGDIKVRLIQDNWYTFFAPIPSISNCQFAAGHSPFTMYRS